MPPAFTTRPLGPRPARPLLPLAHPRPSPRTALIGSTMPTPAGRPPSLTPPHPPAAPLFPPHPPLPSSQIRLATLTAGTPTSLQQLSRTTVPASHSIPSTADHSEGCATFF